ncbi:MAG: DUF1289 domain-containing protein [Rhodocyclaceae bacterium]|nr:DUF1289 domain-containing protein [Rhodocyclaceae bacterium]
MSEITNPATDDESAGPPSPCVGVCRMSDQYRWCEGCLRTLPEIAVWGRATPEHKLRILEEIKKREASLYS